MSYKRCLALILSIISSFVPKTITKDIYQTTKSSDGSLQDKIINSAGSLSFYSKSNIHCGAVCAMVKCPSFFYNHVNQKCQFNDVTFNINDDVTNEIGWRFYFDEGLYDDDILKH